MQLTELRKLCGSQLAIWSVHSNCIRGLQIVFGSRMHKRLTFLRVSRICILEFQSACVSIRATSLSDARFDFLLRRK